MCYVCITSLTIDLSVGNKNTGWQVFPWPYFLCYVTVVYLLWPKYLATLPLFVNEANTVFDIVERSCRPCTKERITLIKEMMRPEGVGYGSPQGNVTSQMLINQVFKMFESSWFSLAFNLRSSCVEYEYAVFIFLFRQNSVFTDVMLTDQNLLSSEKSC